MKKASPISDAFIYPQKLLLSLMSWTQEIVDCFNWIELCVVVRMFVSHKNSYVEILMPFHGIRKCGAFGG